MEKTPSDKHDDADFIFYPTNKVVGFIDDPGNAKAALRALRAAGFTADDVEVLTGEEGAHRIDVTGEEHGPLASFGRSMQKLLGDYEAPHVRRHEEELLAGHFGIGVAAKNREARERVREIMKAHNGHFINYYGEWAMEVLGP